MTKNKFLKLLEEKLKILNDKEKQKIINKYDKLIEKKIKEGKNEKDVIEELGTINEIVNDILENYKKDTDKVLEVAKDTKKIMENLEKIVDKTIKKINNGFQNIEKNLKKSDGSLNLKLVSIFLINMALVLILIILFKFPFNFLSNLGKIFFYIFLSPMNNILSSILDFILGIVYVVVCILTIIISLKKYAGKSLEKKEKNKSNSYTLTLIKIMGTVMVLIPIWCTNFGLIVLTFFLIYLLFEGSSVLGLLILSIGLSLLFGLLADVIDAVLYTHKKMYTFPFLISALLIMIGSMLFTLDMNKFEYFDTVSENIESKELKYEDFISSEIEIDERANINIDESMENGKIVIKIDYYNIVNPVILKDSDSIEFDFIDLKANILNPLINDLKENKIYNYRKIFKTNINVYSNSNTRQLIKK